MDTSTLRGGQMGGKNSGENAMTPDNHETRSAWASLGKPWDKHDG